MHQRATTFQEISFNPSRYPENYILYYNRALAYDSGNDSQNAHRCIREALRMNAALYKNEPVVSTDIGMILSKANELDESKKYLHHALTIDPENKKARALLVALESRNESG